MVRGGQAAGLADEFGQVSSLEAAVTATIYYAGASSGQELVAGAGFSRSTRVAIGGVPATGIRYLSSGFLVVDVPAGVSPTAPVTLLP